MSTLQETLTGAKRSATITDLSQLTRDIIGKQSGLSGIALKGAFSAAQKFSPNIVEQGLSYLFPEIIQTLDLYWDSYQSSPDASFADHLEAHSGPASEALMGVADRAAEKFGNTGIANIYKPVRGKASKVLEENIGEIGRVVENNAK